MKTSVALVASLEVVTEALWAKTEAETEALKPEAEARPRRLKILSRRDRGEALGGLEVASRPRRRDRGHIPTTNTYFVVHSLAFADCDFLVVLAVSVAT